MKIGEVKIEKLVEKYGTPLYVYDGQKIKENYNKIHNAFSSRYKKFKLCYSVKVNNNLSLLKLLKNLGADFDCSSIGEIYLAKKAGGEFLIYTGNYNSTEELKYAIKSKVDIINLDDISLLKKLKKIEIPDKISFRINLQIRLKNSHFVLCGRESKFGIIEKDILPAYRKVKDLGIKVVGIHAMCGSNILDSGYFEIITKRLMEIVYFIKKKVGIEIDFIDIGGGFGIPYNRNENELDIELTAQKVVNVIEHYTKKYKLKKPTLIIEPGRYIMGNAGFLLGKVHVIKNSYKKFVGTDISINSILRVPLFRTQHRMSVEQRKKSKKKEKVSIVGQICWNGDVIAKDVILPVMNVGDIIIIHDVGAYGFCHSNQFNTRRRPAEVLVIKRNHYLIREREEINEFDRLVKIPPPLNKE